MEVDRRALVMSGPTAVYMIVRRHEPHVVTGARCPDIREVEDSQ
jgi:hypothetical protein